MILCDFHNNNVCRHYYDYFSFPPNVGNPKKKNWKILLQKRKETAVSSVGLDAETCETGKMESVYRQTLQQFKDILHFISKF